jgi:CheY-like chemotaxis protein
MGTKLLLADDSITIHKVVSLTFADEDVQIEAVTNGNAALEKARTGKPDIVLADVFMPGRNGYEVCDSIKSDPELAHTPVVLLVGTFEPFDEEEASRVRCDAHLTKPFDTSELIKLIHDLVARQETKVEDMASTPVSEAPALSAAASRGGIETQLAGLISPRTRESFLGEKHILDIFDSSPSEVKAGGEPAKADEKLAAEPGQEQPPGSPRPAIPFPGTLRAAESAPLPIPLPEETIGLIVEEVVKRMSENVVRDVAWEVVPALSEIMIRQYLDELRTNNKS